MLGGVRPVQPHSDPARTCSLFPAVASTTGAAAEPSAAETSHHQTPEDLAEALSADDGYVSDAPSDASGGSLSSAASSDAGSDDEGGDADWHAIAALFGAEVPPAFADSAHDMPRSLWDEVCARDQVARPEGADDRSWLRLRLQPLSPTEELSDEFLDVAFAGREHLMEKLLAVPVVTDRSMVPPELRDDTLRPAVDMTQRPLPVANVPARTPKPRKVEPLQVPAGTWPWHSITLESFRDTLRSHEKRSAERMMRAWARGTGAVNKKPPDLVMGVDDVLVPWARKFFWDCRDPDHCVPMAHAEVECPTLDVDGAQAAVGDAYPNQETLFRWRFGFRLKQQRMPRMLVICQPQLSAFAWMRFLQEGIDTELGAGWLEEASSGAAGSGVVPPFVPGHYESIGCAVKKHSDPPKPRRLTDKSQPAGNAINDFITLLEAFAKLKFVRPEQHAEAAAVLAALAAALGLPLLGFADDFKAWFSQLAIAPAERYMHGYAWVAADGTVHYPWSNRVQFGGRPGPNLGQESMDLVLYAARRRFRVQALKLEALGMVPGGEALDRISRALRHWRSLRRELADGNPTETDETPLGQYEDAANSGAEPSLHSQLSPAWEAGYIDDTLALVVGLKLLIIWILSFWQCCGELGIETVASKAQLGTTVKHLGLVFLYDLSLVVLPRDKLQRLVDWCNRLVGLKKAKRKEIESFNGTVNFCSLVNRKTRLRLTRLYRALTATFSHRYQVRDQIRITKGIKADVSEIADLFLMSGGISCFPMDAWAEPGRPDHGFYQSDACRNPDDQKSWSGMGGFFAGYYWWIRLTWDEVTDLPVHLTEGVANLINTDILGEKAAGGKITEECDSAPVVDAFNAAAEYRQIKDPRLQELARLREAISAKHNLLTRLRYIATDDNTLADLLSRGAFSAFRKEAGKLGYGELTRVSVPARFKSLLTLLRKMTAELNSNR